MGLSTEIYIQKLKRKRRMRLLHEKEDQYTVKMPKFGGICIDALVAIFGINGDDLPPYV